MGTRYDMGVIAARVEQRRAALGIPPKQAADFLELRKWDWSRKARNSGSSFTIGELAKLADKFEAPTGWPFIEEKLGAAIDSMLCAAARSAPSPGESDSGPSPASRPSADAEGQTRRGGSRQH